MPKAEYVPTWEELTERAKFPPRKIQIDHTFPPGNVDSALGWAKLNHRTGQLILNISQGTIGPVTWREQKKESPSPPNGSSPPHHP